MWWNPSRNPSHPISSCKWYNSCTCWSTMVWGWAGLYQELKPSIIACDIARAVLTEISQSVSACSSVFRISLVVSDWNFQTWTASSNLPHRGHAEWFCSFQMARNLPTPHMPEACFMMNHCLFFLQHCLANWIACQFMVSGSNPNFPFCYQ